MTVTIQIGNSDDKLTQAEWSRFQEDMSILIEANTAHVHFCGVSHGDASWQNAAWVIDYSAPQIARLKDGLAKLKAKYRQDSIAWTEGKTEFV